MRDGMDLGLFLNVKKQRQDFQSLGYIYTRAKAVQWERTCSGKDMREEMWLASKGSLTFKATFEPEVSV